MLSFLSETASEDPSNAFQDLLSSEMEAMSQVGDPNSLSNRLELSEMLKDSAMASPEMQTPFMSSELKSLLTPDASDLINVSRPSKPSLTEAYARAGLI